MNFLWLGYLAAFSASPTHHLHASHLLTTAVNWLILTFYSQDRNVSYATDLCNAKFASSELSWTIDNFAIPTLLQVADNAFAANNLWRLRVIQCLCCITRPSWSTEHCLWLFCFAQQPLTFPTDITWSLLRLTHTGNITGCNTRYRNSYQLSCDLCNAVSSLDCLRAMPLNYLPCASAQLLSRHNCECFTPLTCGLPLRVTS